MTSTQQLRNKYAAIFPEIAEVILDEGNCYSKIFRVAREISDVLERVGVPDGEVALRWAFEFPEDSERMRQFVTESWDAFHWALKFPRDREHMRPFVNQSFDALHWALRFPEDRERMRKFVTKLWDAFCWVFEFPEDREYFVAKGLLEAE